MKRRRLQNSVPYGLALVFILSSMGSVIAQDSVRMITLEDAVQAALKNNKEIVLAELDEKIAAARYRQTDAVFLPQLNVSYTAMSTNNPLNAFGFKLQQQSITVSDFNPDLLNNPSDTRDFVTRVDLQQPLLNLDMIYMRKAADRQVDLYSYKTKRTKEYLTFEVQKAYHQLELAHHAVQVLEEALVTVQSIYTSASNRFEKGFLQKSDVLNVQVQVTSTESKLAEARSNIRNASDYLSLLMGEPAGNIFRTETTLVDTAPVSNDGERKVSDSRSDFQALQAAVEAQDFVLKSSKMNYLPKLNAFATYQLNDKEALGFGSDAYLAGIQLSWSLFKGMTTRSSIAAHQAERNKTAEQLNYQKEQSQLELNKTLRQLEDAKFHLRQQEAAVDQAAEALRIVRNRYEQGLVATNDILLSQAQLSQQKLAQANARFQYYVTETYLQFLTITSTQQ